MALLSVIVPAQAATGGAYASICFELCTFERYECLIEESSLVRFEPCIFGRAVYLTFRIS